MIAAVYGKTHLFYRKCQQEVRARKQQHKSFKEITTFVCSEYGNSCQCHLTNRNNRAYNVPAHMPSNIGLFSVIAEIVFIILRHCYSVDSNVMTTRYITLSAGTSNVMTTSVSTTQIFVETKKTLKAKNRI